MKGIRIFIASSEELSNERITLGGLVCKLEKIFEEEGFALELLEWEDFDSAYNGVRKQDEYNEKIRTADIFIGLFWTKAGAYTLEEYNVAKQSFKEKSTPRIHVFFKQEDKDYKHCVNLNSFITRTVPEDRTHSCTFNGMDELKLAFVRTILNDYPLKKAQLKEDNGVIRLGNIKIANASKQGETCVR